MSLHHRAKYAVAQLVHHLYFARYSMKAEFGFTLILHRGLANHRSRHATLDIMNPTFRNLLFSEQDNLHGCF